MDTDQRPDILVIIESYGIKVKQTGNNLMALCPFHEDHKPSLSIDRQKGLYNCFGCNVSGDVYSFVAQMESLSVRDDFPKVKKIAHEKGGVQLVETRTKSIKDTGKKPFHIDFNKAHNRLMESLDGKSAREYLKRRKIKKAMWERFQLGFVNEGRYKNRIIIPIKDNWFTTRTIADEEPKSLNAPGEIPSLFNMGILKEFDSVFLVEGVMDALTMIQAGSDNTVGLLGTTSFKEGFAEKFTEKDVVIITDNDEAGERARANIQRKLEGVGATITQVYFTGGNDINEIYQKREKDFDQLLCQTIAKAEEEKDRHWGDEDYLEETFLKQEVLQSPIKTGLEGVDEILGGGFYPGVIMLGGETAIGKTGLAVYFTIKAAEEQKRVLYLTYELSKKQMWSRIFGVVMKNPFRDIHFNPDRGSDYKDVYRSKIKDLARYIKILEDYAFEDIEITAFNYDMVVVDYLQRMPKLKEEDSRERRIQITNLVHRLQKDIARIHDITVLVLSSYSRGATMRDEPGITAYKESGDIEYTAQVAMSLWYPGSGDWRMIDEPSLRLNVYKNTIGATGYTVIKYTKRTGAFYETEK